ncbi:zinc finger protein 37-like [Contarinia nasturtii]|uniref:zinc finger protein 37-like n=1 Tax=Contarinia nasturtii TaxID=265458 RepID=UPI0012D439BB|nr:zinc finger protein 37-like [Contarinia nasturtii]
MDQKIRVWLKELATNVLQTLDSAEDGNRNSRCGCLKILNDVSKKLREAVNAFPDEKEIESSQESQSTQQSASTLGVSGILTGTGHQSRSRTTKSSSDANATVATTRPKRKCTPNPKYANEYPYVKLQRLDLKKLTVYQRRKSFDVLPAKTKQPNSIEDVAKSGPDSQIRNNIKKRRRTIALDRPNVDGENTKVEHINVERKQSVMKNTNPNIYYTNNLYQTLCVFCDNKAKNMVSHYVKHHPNHEVAIARPSPSMANSIRAQSQRFDSFRSKISGICFFCEEIKTLTKSSWINHILTHTGESLFHCTSCKAVLKDRSDFHSNCNQRNLITIFELNDSPEGALTAFMCKECNYLQINQNQLTEHLRNQHGFSKKESIKYFERITLIPNMNPIREIFEYEFLDNDTLCKCNICNVQLANLDEFQVHFDREHTQLETPIDAYTCPCGQVKKLHGTSILRALGHMYKHSENVFKCLSCKDNVDNIYYFERGILHHLAHQHLKDEWKFQYLHREAGTQTVFIETTFNKFICNCCNTEFKQVRNALKHFQELHPTQLIDFRAVVVKKSSRFAHKLSDFQTSSMATNDYIFRQSFLCTSCDYVGTSKEKLLTHNNEAHTSTMLELKLGAPMLIHLNTHPDECEKLNEIFDRLLLYSCYWCYNGNQTFIGSTVEEVHDHWLSEHSEQPEEKFRFYTEPLVKCYYCEVITTYKGMQEHFEKKHKSSNIHFVNVNVNDKCPMCDHVCDNLPEHIDTKHNAILKLDMFNVNRFATEEIKRLLAIDVYKKQQCNHCGEIFEREKECRFHNEKKHSEEAVSMRGVFDNEQKGLISACCDDFISPLNFFNHLNEHNFEFLCHNCNLKFEQLETVAQHDLVIHKSHTLHIRRSSLSRTLRNMFYRTKMCYGNGLVLYKQNVRGTDYDDTITFERFLLEKIDEHTKKYNALTADSSYSNYE